MPAEVHKGPELYSGQNSKVTATSAAFQSSATRADRQVCARQGLDYASPARVELPRVCKLEQTLLLLRVYTDLELVEVGDQAFKADKALAVPGAVDREQDALIERGDNFRFRLGRSSTEEPVSQMFESDHVDIIHGPCCPLPTPLSWCRTAVTSACAVRARAASDV